MVVQKILLGAKHACALKQLRKQVCPPIQEDLFAIKNYLQSSVGNIWRAVNPGVLSEREIVYESKTLLQKISVGVFYCVRRIFNQ